MSVYLYVLVAVLVSCSALVAADVCFPLNATFAVTPRICYPTYTISELYAQNNTGGDRLSSVLKTLSTADNLPSQQCAQAFSTYYCSQIYPECAAGTTKPACASSCSAVATACANYTSLFNAEFPIPTQSDCNALATTGCRAASGTNLTTFYTDCIGNYNTSLVPNVVTPVCQPTYTIPSANFTYATGKNVYDALRTWIISYGAAQPAEGSGDPPNWMYPCIKVWSNFWCAKTYPVCPENGALQNTLPVCRSMCQLVLDYCNETIYQYFNPTNANGYVMPTTAICNPLPNSPGVDCVIPPGGNNNTNVAFFFGADPPSNETVTPAPTPAPTGWISNGGGIEYPPGGAAKGGGIGAAVLVGILIVIGILMLIMKKQDSR